MMEAKATFVEKRIDQLVLEQREIESQLSVMMNEKVINPFAVRALKQRSSTVNHQISQLRTHLIPDIIA